MDEIVPQRTARRRLTLARGTLAAAALFSAAAVSSAAPPLDTTFGASGIVTMPMPMLGPRTIHPLRDGRVIAIATPSSAHSTAPRGSFVPRFIAFRYTAEGAADTTFGNQGRIELPLALVEDTHAFYRYPIVELDNGGFIVMAQRGSCFALQRFAADGSTVGGAFSQNLEGTADCSGEGLENFGLGMQADGKLVVYGNLVARSDLTGNPVIAHSLFVIRMLPDGTRDPAFGANGRVVVAANVFGPQLHLEADGRLLFASSSASFFRMNSDGSVDATFGEGGKRSFPLPNRFEDRCVTWALSIGALGWSAIQDCETFSDIVRLTKDAQPVPGFGAGGIVRLPKTLDNQYREHAFVQRDGSVVIVGGRGSSVNPTIVIERLGPDGLRDTRVDLGDTPLSVNGYSQFSGAALQADGNVLVGSINSIGRWPDSFFEPGNSTLLRVRAMPPVVEFHNALLGHYFISLDDGEARGIDNGAAGQGWARTSLGFAVGGPDPTCRFYGAGFNSHFFTAEPGECEQVKKDPGWFYEGVGFHVTRVLPSGGCSPSLRPVHRLYNNRAAQRDSNHRFVVDTALIPAMAAAGWAHEGVVFCVPR
jgi:uncharacterized delta-60 repeat protein